MSIATARVAVAKGAALLDEEIPGWAEKIDLGILELSSTEQCVLGQLFEKPQTVTHDFGHGPETMCVANYLLGKVVLHLDVNDCINNGFEQGVTLDGEKYTSYSSYSDLDKAWTEEVKARHDNGVL